MFVEVIESFYDLSDVNDSLLEALLCPDAFVWTAEFEAEWDLIKLQALLGENEEVFHQLLSALLEAPMATLRILSAASHLCLLRNVSSDVEKMDAERLMQMCQFLRVRVRVLITVESIELLQNYLQRDFSALQIRDAIGALSRSSDPMMALVCGVVETFSIEPSGAAPISFCPACLRFTLGQSVWHFSSQQLSLRKCDIDNKCASCAKKRVSLSAIMGDPCRISRLYRVSDVDAAPVVESALAPLGDSENSDPGESFAANRKALSLTLSSVYINAMLPKSLEVRLGSPLYLFGVLDRMDKETRDGSIVLIPTLEVIALDVMPNPLGLCFGSIGNGRLSAFRKVVAMVAGRIPLLKAEAVEILLLTICHSYLPVCQKLRLITSDVPRRCLEELSMLTSARLVDFSLIGNCKSGVWPTVSMKTGAQFKLAYSRGCFGLTQCQIWLDIGAVTSAAAGRLSDYLTNRNVSCHPGAKGSWSILDPDQSSIIANCEKEQLSSRTGRKALLQVARAFQCHLGCCSVPQCALGSAMATPDGVGRQQPNLASLMPANDIKDLLSQLLTSPDEKKVCSWSLEAKSHVQRYCTTERKVKIGSHLQLCCFIKYIIETEARLCDMEIISPETAERATKLLDTCSLNQDGDIDQCYPVKTSMNWLRKEMKAKKGGKSMSALVSSFMQLLQGEEGLITRQHAIEVATQLLRSREVVTYVADQVVDHANEMGLILKTSDGYLIS